MTVSVSLHNNTRVRPLGPYRKSRWVLSVRSSMLIYTAPYRNTYRLQSLETAAMKWVLLEPYYSMVSGYASNNI